MAGLLTLAPMGRDHMTDRVFLGRALVGSHKSVKDAVPSTYEAELVQFIAQKESHAARALGTTS